MGIIKREIKKERKKLVKVFKYLENNIEQAKVILPSLFYSENVVLRTKIAAHCLALSINVYEAEKVLELDAKNEDNGIFGFNAERTLKVWIEGGKLEVYQK